MQVDSLTYNLIDFCSSTAIPVPMEEISTLFSRVDLDTEFFRLYGHIAEVVSNIYQHSVGDSGSAVGWRLTVTRSKDLLIIAISDDGQGIYNSISKRTNKPLSKLEAFALALNEHSTPSHRGKGLQGLLKGVRRGGLIRISIESDSYLFRADSSISGYSRTSHKNGCKVVITAELNGGGQ
jgi:hypothetical protein